MSDNTASLLRLAMVLAFLSLLAVLNSCTVYPHTHASYTTKYGTATVPRRDKENRH